MKKDLLIMIELMDCIINTVDPDGMCENGCACSECTACIEYNEIIHDFNVMKEKYTS